VRNAARRRRSAHFQDDDAPSFPCDTRPMQVERPAGNDAAASVTRGRSPMYCVPPTRYVMGAAIIELPMNHRTQPFKSDEYAFEAGHWRRLWKHQTAGVASTPPSQLVAVCASQTTRCSGTLHARRKPREADVGLHARASWLIGGSVPYRERMISVIASAERPAS